MRDSHSSKWMPRGWAKRLATSEGRLKPDSPRLGASSSSSVSVTNSSLAGALDRPEEQCSQPGILLQGASCPRCGLGPRWFLGPASDASRPTTSQTLFQVFGEGDLLSHLVFRPSGIGCRFRGLGRCRRRRDPRPGRLRPPVAASSPQPGHGQFAAIHRPTPRWERCRVGVCTLGGYSLPGQPSLWPGDDKPLFSSNWPRACNCPTTLNHARQ